MLIILFKVSSLRLLLFDIRIQLCVRFSDFFDVATQFFNTVLQLFALQAIDAQFFLSMHFIQALAFKPLMSLRERRVFAPKLRVHSLMTLSEFGYGRVV